jgi:hypothetical protein
MKPSKFDGKFVNYIDPLKIQHKGVVVGQTLDTVWTFIQSTNPKVAPADWHFKVKSALVKSIIAE